MFKSQKWFGSVIVLFFLTAAFSQDGKKETPTDIKAFLNEVKTNLLHNNELAKDYMYRVKVTDNDLGFTERNVYEVYHFRMACETCFQKALMNAVDYYIYPFKTQTYERLIDGDGPPEAKNDAPMDDPANEKNLTDATRRKAAEKEIDEIFDVFDIRIIGKEEIDGHPAFVVRYTPRKEAKPKSGHAKFLKNLEGRAWIEENERQIIKIEAYVVDNASFGAGPLAKIQKGARFIEEKRKVNKEVWLPSRSEFTYKVKLLLIPSHTIREVEEYYDYRKFTVDTRIEYGEPK